MTHLALYGGYARGRRMRGSEGLVDESVALITLIREGWGKKNDTYLRMFGTIFMPEADTKQLSEFAELQRLATSPENAARVQMSLDQIDILHELPNVKAPTLVMHASEDARAPFEEGRRMAAAIPGARFVALEGRNHSMLDGEPALTRYLDELEAFLKS